MSVPHEIYLEAQPTPSQPRFPRLRSFARRVFHLPGLRALRPALKRVQAVAEPAGRLYVRTPPAGTQTEEPPAITILSANLWHDWPKHRRIAERLESFAGLVEAERADVLLLQEVSRTPALHVDAWLAGRLNMGSIYSRANGHEAAIGFEEGLAIFSRYPLLDFHLRQLGTRSNPFVRRLALGAEVATPFGTFLAFSVHLGLRRKRNVIQMSDLRDWVEEIAGLRPTLIGGDFNAHERSTQIAQIQRHWLDTFRHLHPEKDAATHELRWPWGGLLRRHRLDYIFLGPGNHSWQVLETRHVDAPDGLHSDHRAVLARLALDTASS